LVPRAKASLLYFYAEDMLDGLGGETAKVAHNLARRGFRVLGDMIQLHDDEILKWGQASPDALARIKRRLGVLGLQLHMRIDPWARARRQDRLVQFA
jgi:hypothetical protein